MKNFPALATALRTSYNMTAVPKAIIEWNMNRYFIPTATNSVDETTAGFDVDIFPIESIVEPWRPTKGINRAILGQSVISSAHNDYPQPRSYVASDKDKYKYWASPYASDINGFISGVAPQVIYNETVQINKIKAVVENTWATPSAFSLQYTVDSGNSWVTVNTTSGVQANGTIESYWTGSQWSGTRPAVTPSTSVAVNGVRFVCTKLGPGILANGYQIFTRQSSPNGSYSNLALIELAGCLVRDISKDIISSDSTLDAGEVSVVAPVGRLTSNTGTIVLWNENNQFSTESTNVTYKRLIEQNAEVSLSYVYTVGNSTYEVPDFRMYVDQWINNEDGTVTVELSDASKHLAEIKPNATKFENMRFSEIIYRLLDSVGWNRYNSQTASRGHDLVVPIFWTDGEKTIWELLEELAEVSQSVIYFDENGMLNVKTRGDAYSRTAAPVWTLRGKTTGNELADIETLGQTGEYGSNVVKITYKDTNWADMNNGFAENTVVWEAEDPTVLRSSPLAKTLTEAERGAFVMSGFDAATWPHQGKVLIEGEVIEYDAKMFVYQDGGTFHWDWVTSQAQHNDYNERVQSAGRHLNRYDGQFRIKERGQWNTAIKAHYVDATGYSVTRHVGGTTKSGGGFHHFKRESMVGLRTTGLHDGPDDLLLVTRGVPGDSPWRYIGTRMAHTDSASRHQAGGIVWNMQSGKDGYYAELCPTSQIKEKDRDARNEVIFYVIKNGKRSPNFPTKGTEATVALDGWAELDIWTGYPNHRVAIWYRGTQVFAFEVPGEWRLNPSGKFGMFSRGSSDIRFDYLYASSNASEPEPEADYSSVHAIEAVNIGRSYAEEWKHRNTKRERRKRRKTKKAIFDTEQRFMDEFGPYVHEFKEFEVKFEPAPVLSSSIYVTNEWAAYLVDYRPSAFGAEFIIVNTERYNAILAGNDTLTEPLGEGIDQHTMISGRALVVGEGQEIVVKNDQQVRARGEIVTEIQSDWIQSEEAAKAIGDWIIEHWSSGVDELAVTIFGNPLFQIGDVVAVDYPLNNMASASHHYFITSITNSFDSGVATTLTLRRRN